MIVSCMHAPSSFIRPWYLTPSFPSGSKHVVGRKQMDRLKSGCIVCNMGHSNQEIDIHSLRELKREKIRRNVTHLVWPNGKRVILLADVSLSITTVCGYHSAVYVHIT